MNHIPVIFIYLPTGCVLEDAPIWIIIPKKYTSHLNRPLDNIDLWIIIMIFKK